MGVDWKFGNDDMEFCWRLRYVGINDCYKTEVRWRGVGIVEENPYQKLNSVSLYIFISSLRLHIQIILCSIHHLLAKKLNNHETWKIFVINVVNEKVREKWIFWLLILCEKVLGLYFLGDFLHFCQQIWTQNQIYRVMITISNFEKIFHLLILALFANLYPNVHIMILRISGCMAAILGSSNHSNISLNHQLNLVI
jgi:hypothetical protein